MTVPERKLGVARVQPISAVLAARARSCSLRCAAVGLRSGRELVVVVAAARKPVTESGESHSAATAERRCARLLNRQHVPYWYDKVSPAKERMESLVSGGARAISSYSCCCCR
jgi:nucleotidyltransferase/DNA polymerase involved in DNA repair